MKINLKESLNELDVLSNNRYDLYNTYLSKNPSLGTKKKLSEAIYKNKSPKEIALILKEDWDDAAWHDTADQEQVDQPDYFPDGEEESGWTEIDSKSVRDSDGFLTDYTWYWRNNNGKDQHVFVFGDSDLYGPEDGYFDWECDSLEEAQDWFDSYVGPGDDDDDWMDESLKEDVSKEWKPNLNFKHIKDVLEKALSRGKYINNEREEVKAALDLCDKKQKYTPEQRRFIQDSHREMWKKNRKTESLKEEIDNDAKEKLDFILSKYFYSLASYKLSKDGKYYLFFYKDYDDGKNHLAQRVPKNIFKKSLKDIDSYFNNHNESSDFLDGKYEKELNESLKESFPTHVYRINLRSVIQELWERGDALGEEDFIEVFDPHDVVKLFNGEEACNRVEFTGPDDKKIRVNFKTNGGYVEYQILGEDWKKASSIDEIWDAVLSRVGKSINESVEDIHNDFEVGRKYWNKLNLDIDFDSALDKWNKSSELAEPDTWYSKPLYSKEAWNDMVSMFSNMDESLDESSEFEYVEYICFEDNKIALKTEDKDEAVSFAKNNPEIDQVLKVTYDDPVAKAYNTNPSNVDVVYDRMDESLKKKVMKVESLNKELNTYVVEFSVGPLRYDDIDEITVKAKNEENALKIAEKKVKKTKSYKTPCNFHIKKSEDHTNESLNEKMVKVEPSDKELNQVINVLTKYGFKVDDNYKPGRGLFGSYHIQVINPDLDYIDFDQLVKDVEPVGDALDDISSNINMPITYSFGANNDNVITGGIDIHVGYKEDDIDEFLKEDWFDDFQDNYTFEVRGYFDSKLRGLDYVSKSNDLEEIKDLAWSGLQDGDYILVSNLKTGNRIVLNPDEEREELDELNTL